jgi:hypothetical protein
VEEAGYIFSNFTDMNEQRSDTAATRTGKGCQAVNGNMSKLQPLF